MPKLIDYPRTSYTGAWELAEIVDDTGGKSSIETAARKLNRKVSGSFKAIIGSAVKFGLMTSKRELLTATTLFKRIKHAYDKAEELQFHREAFLTPPLFTQLCRKFRNRELPVQMLDVMLIREFGVEEINAQGVAKAFVDGCRMCGLIDERNIIADIDALNNARTPRRELASVSPSVTAFTPTTAATTQPEAVAEPTGYYPALGLFSKQTDAPNLTAQPDVPPHTAPDTVANLFGLNDTVTVHAEATPAHVPPVVPELNAAPTQADVAPIKRAPAPPTPPTSVLPTASASIAAGGTATYHMQMSGPGVNTLLDITDEDDLSIAIALLEKIRRQLRATH